MVRRKRGVAIIVLKCAVIGFYAGDQQVALGAEMAAPSKPAGGVFEGTVGSNARPGLLDTQFSESGQALLFPLILVQPDLVASASQAVGGYILMAQETKNAGAPAEPQSVVQETKNADAPAEPQAVMREIKSVPRLSSSKLRRRKPKMAGVPAGSAVAQATKEPGLQAVAKETKDSGLQATQETEEVDTLDNPLAVTQEKKNAGIPPEPQAEVKELKVAEVGKKKYRMAPIQWGVKLSETLSLERHSQTVHRINDKNSLYIFTPNGSGQSRAFVHTQTAEIHAKSYVMQQYIAQVGGKVGVVSSKTTNSFSGTNGFSGFSSINGFNNSVNNNRNNQLFGDGNLSLFPKSRFPFTMSLGVSDSRDNYGLATNDQRMKHLSLNQVYKPRRGTSLYNISYENNALSYTVPVGISTHSYWLGKYTTSSPEHKVSVETRFNDKFTSSRDNLDRRINNFTVSDYYLPSDSLLSLNSFANIYSSTDNAAGNNSGTRYLQASTNATWQPESEDIPLFVTGKLQFFRVTNTFQSVAIPLQSLGMNVGATYLFSKNLTGRADGGVTSTNSNGTQNLITTQRGSVTYSSNAINLWKNASYSWHADGGAANQTGGSSVLTGTGSDSSVFGGVGHGLSVPYSVDMLGKKWQLGSKIDQSLTTNIDRINGQSTTLYNAGRISLAPMALVSPSKDLMGGYGKTSGLSAKATLSVVDRRIIGKGQSHNRIYILTLNETNKTGYKRAGLEVEATLGAVQGTQGNGIALIGAATVKYSKSKVFNVRGLDYSAALTVTGQSTQSDSINRVVDANATNPRFPWLLDQNLRYKIGQNEVTLRGRVSDQYGVKNASLWLLFRAWRNIGY